MGGLAACFLPLTCAAGQNSRYCWLIQIGGGEVMKKGISDVSLFTYKNAHSPPFLNREEITQLKASFLAPHLFQAASWPHSPLFLVFSPGFVSVIIQAVWSFRSLAVSACSLSVSSSTWTILSIHTKPSFLLISYPRLSPQSLQVLEQSCIVGENTDLMSPSANLNKECS